jgi:hypothetical protein
MGFQIQDNRPVKGASLPGKIVQIYDAYVPDRRG